jgi:hypothetical protein
MTNELRVYRVQVLNPAGAPMDVLRTESLARALGRMHVEPGRRYIRVIKTTGGATFEIVASRGGQRQ